MCFYSGLEHWMLTDIYTHRWCLTLRFSSNDTQIMQNQQQLKPSKLWFYDIKITCVTGHVSAPLINRMHNSTMHGGFMNFIDITILYCKIAAVHSSAGETADHIELAISRFTCNELNWIEPTLRTLYVSYEIFAFSTCSIRWRSTMSMIHKNWNQPKPPYSQFVQTKNKAIVVSRRHIYSYSHQSPNAFFIFLAFLFIASRHKQLVGNQMQSLLLFLLSSSGYLHDACSSAPKTKQKKKLVCHVLFLIPSQCNVPCACIKH